MMISSNLISVVIPIYNGETNFRRCLNSLLAQTYPHWECILVDDGSKDNSGAICDEYAQKDKRFRVIHKHNEGVTKSRQLGVVKASGDWIAFVDADDSLPNTALNELYNKGVQFDLDIVMGYSIDFMGTIGTKIEHKIPSGIYDRVSYIKAILSEHCIYGPACKIIKRKLFDEIAFALPKAVYQNEDMYMNIVLGSRASNIGIYNDIHAYNYTLSSISSFQKQKGFMPTHAWDILFDFIEKYLTDNNLYEICKKEFSNFVHRRMYMVMLNTKNSFFAFNTVCFSWFDYKVSALNNHPILWKLYFQLYRMYFITKHLFR